MNAKVLRLMRRYYGVPLRRTHEKLPPEVLEGIAQGLADVEAGRVTTFDEIKKKYPLKSD
jgi:hypothetical protein